MNETVLNLAIRTAILLKSNYQDPTGIPEYGLVTQYFETLGVNAGEVKQYLAKNLELDLKWLARAALLVA